MSRKVRYHFAAPLVMTLAVAPACVVRSAPPPNSNGPTTGANTGSVHATVNPPPPKDTTVAMPVDDREPFPDRGTGTAQQPEATAPRLGAWTIYQNPSDHLCFVQIKVDCPPKGATCNPPPPRATECPTGMAMDRPIELYEQSPGVCFLQPPIPPCPRNAKCKAPPPQKTDCPSP